MEKMRSLGTVLLSLCIIAAHAQKKQVRTGNELYEQKKYKEAAEAYQKALAKQPAYMPGIFNLGNALFQQKNYDASRQVMTSAVRQAKDRNVKADASYNIGNTYMQEQKWEQAVDAYKQALRNNPQDEAAKYNLSYALAMMKKNQGGGGKNNDKNKDQNKDKQDQNKDKGDQNKEQQQDQNKDKKDQNKEQQDQNQQDPQDQQDKHSQTQPSKLSEQQADQLLNALAQEEKKLHDKKEKGKAVKIKVDKDW